MPHVIGMSMKKNVIKLIINRRVFFFTYVKKKS